MRFSYIWVHSGPFGCLTKLGAKRAELVQKFVPRSCVRIFATNAPDPLHWTLNSCIGAFRSVWVHFGLFRYCMKLGAKRDELVQLMQKFVTQSRVELFRNKRTRSTPLQPKLMFWCVSKYLGSFGNVSLLHETRSKTSWIGVINAQVRAMKSHWNFSQQMQLSHPIEP